jgi:putative phosphoesterase
VRIAILGAVRANLPALEAVLADASSHKVDAVWTVGDFAGYGPFPGEVIDLLREMRALCVLGSDELLLLKLHQMHESAHRTMQQEFAPLRHAHAHLSEEHHRFLLEAPRQIELAIAGVRVLVVNGSSTVWPSHKTTLEHLRILADESHAQVVVYGHGHEARTHRIGGIAFVNPGSVGQSHDGDPRATYGILTVTPRVVRTRFIRVCYPVEAAVAAIGERGLPPSFATALLQGALPDLPTAEAPPQVPEEESDPRVRAVLELARSCEYEAEHTHQVTRLAIKLFDDLAGLHGLGVGDRFLLRCAALLHDIGWVEGQQAHHKAALRIILNSPLLPFGERERLIIGSVARYHRKALPAATHEHYTVLTEADRRLVGMMAGILRVADGLDRTHRSLVDDFTCSVSPKKIIIKCLVHWPAEMERQAALDKGQLLESALGRHLAIEWRLA